MSYVFPYDVVERGSKVALYGAGVVGKDFYLQIKKMNYCSLVVWVDKAFQGYTRIDVPFDYVDGIDNYDFDYIVVAVLDRKIAGEIQDDLISRKIPEDKIVWSENYEIKNYLWPMNKAKMLSSFRFFEDIMDKYKRAASVYGGGRFYQSFTELGISGTRDTQERLAIYQVDRFLNRESTVLDIGCNCGFLDLQMCSRVKWVEGIEIEPLLVEIAEETRKYMGIENAHFLCGDFYTLDIKKQYSAIFSFAVHSNIMVSGASEREYVDKVYESILPEGYLFFESHNLLNDRVRYLRLCDMFVERGMQVCLHENYSSDFDRDIVVLQKNN